MSAYFVGPALPSVTIDPGYSRDDRYPDVTALGNSGEFVVTWNAQTTSGAAADRVVYVQRFDASGAKLDPLPVQFKTSGGTDQNSHPQISALGNQGDFVFTWNGYDSGNPVVLVQRFDHGSGWQPLTQFASIDNAQPSVCVLNNGTDFVVSWLGNMSSGATTYTQVALVQKFVGGAPSGALIPLWPSTGPNGSLSPADISALGNSGFVAVWDRVGPFFVQRFDDSGMAVAPAATVAVATGTSYGGGARVTAVGAGGEFVVSWQGTGTDSKQGYFVQKFASTGATIGTPYDVTDGLVATHARDYNISAVGTDGDFVVVWSQDETATTDQMVAVRMFDNNPDVAPQPKSVVLLDGDTASPSVNKIPQVVAQGGSGEFVVLWSDALFDDGYVQKFNSSGLPVGGVVRLAGGYYLEADVSAVGTSGEFVVARTAFGWSADISADIFVQKFSADGMVNGPPLITLSADSGNPTDFITNNPLQTIHATLSGSRGADHVLGSTDNGSTWSNLDGNLSGNNLTWEASLVSGPNTIRLKIAATDNATGPELSQAYTLDMGATGLKLDLADASDTGASATDNITNDTTPTFDVTGEAGAIVNVFNDVDSDNAVGQNESLGTVVLSSTGTGSVTALTMVGGYYDKLKAIQTDVAGNTEVTGVWGSTGSLGHVNIDTINPITLHAASPLALSVDNGTSTTDFKTDTAAQTITATLAAELAGGEILSGSVDNGGTWTDITGKVIGTALTWNGATLLRGGGSIQLKVTDPAGNDSVVRTQPYTLELAPGLHLSNLSARMTDFDPTNGATAAPSYGAVVNTDVASGRVVAHFSSAAGGGAELSRTNLLQLLDTSPTTGSLPYVTLPVVSTLGAGTSYGHMVLTLALQGLPAASVGLDVRMETVGSGSTKTTTVKVDGNQSPKDFISFADGVVLGQTKGDSSNSSLDLYLLRLLDQGLAPSAKNLLSLLFSNDLDATVSAGFTGLPIYDLQGTALTGLDVSVSIDDTPNRVVEVKLTLDPGDDEQPNTGDDGLFATLSGSTATLTWNALQPDGSDPGTLPDVGPLLTGINPDAYGFVSRSALTTALTTADASNAVGVQVHAVGAGGSATAQFQFPQSSTPQQPAERLDVTLTPDNGGTTTTRDDGVVLAGNDPQATLTWNALYSASPGSTPQVGFSTTMSGLPTQLSVNGSFVSNLTLRASIPAAVTTLGDVIGVQVTATGGGSVDTARYLFNPVVDLSTKLQTANFSAPITAPLTPSNPSASSFNTLDLTGVPMSGAIDFNLGRVFVPNAQGAPISYYIGDGFDHFVIDQGRNFFGRDDISEMVSVTAGGNYLSLGMRQELPGGPPLAGSPPPPVETDVVDYRSFDGGFAVDLASADAASGEVGVHFYAANNAIPNDTLVNVEGVFGSQGGDSIWGDERANLIAGEAGNDDLEGNGGNDLIYGGGGTDDLSGGDGDDFLVDLAGENNLMRGDMGNDIYVTGDGDPNLGQSSDHAIGTVVSDFENSDEFARLPGRGELVNDSVAFRVDLEQAGLLGLGGADYIYTTWKAYIQDNIFPNLRLEISAIQNQPNDRVLSLVWDPVLGETVTLADITLNHVGANLTDYYSGIPTHQLHAFFLHGDVTPDFDDAILREMFGFDIETNALFVRAAIEKQRLGTLVDSSGHDVVIGADGTNVLTPAGGDDTLSGGSGADRYEYHMQDFDPSLPTDSFGSDVIIDWGDRSEDDADVLHLEGVNSVADLSFTRFRYAKEGVDGSLKIDVTQKIDGDPGTTSDDLTNTGAIVLFNQYSRSQTGYRIENLELEDNNGIEHIYDLGRVAGRAVAGPAGDPFQGGGDILTMVGVNDAILVGSSRPDEFKIHHQGSGDVLTAHLFGANSNDRLTYAGTELASFLDGASNWTAIGTAGAPTGLKITLDTGIDPVDANDDTIMKLMFHGGDWLQDYLSPGGSPPL